MLDFTCCGPCGWIVCQIVSIHLGVVLNVPTYWRAWCPQWCPHIPYFFHFPARCAISCDIIDI